MSLPVKRPNHLCEPADVFATWQLRSMLLNAQRTVQAFRGLLAQNSKATAMLLQKQIATERERERAQRQIGEAMRASDYNYEAYKLENAKVADLSAQLANAERERDNARAALEECQKLNATLREDVAKVTERRNLIKESWDAVFQEKERLIKVNATLREELAMTLAGADADAFTIGVLNTKLASVTNENATLREEMDVLRHKITTQYALLHLGPCGMYVQVKIYDLLDKAADLLKQARPALNCANEQWQEDLEALQKALKAEAKFKHWTPSEQSALEQLAIVTSQRDRAMFYARHRSTECDQMENADCECTCGLTELREEIK